MTREQYVSYCEVCELKGFSPKLGLVCSLTNERPNFEKECESLQKSEGLVAQAAKDQQRREAIFKADETLGLNKIGVENKVQAGIVIGGFALLSILATIIVWAIISLWSVVLLIIGISVMVLGFVEKSKRNNS